MRRKIFFAADCQAELTGLPTATAPPFAVRIPYLLPKRSARRPVARNRSAPNQIDGFYLSPTVSDQSRGTQQSSSRRSATLSHQIQSQQIPRCARNDKSLTLFIRA